MSTYTPPDLRHTVSVNEIIAKAARFEEPPQRYYESLEQPDNYEHNDTTITDLERWAEEVEMDLKAELEKKEAFEKETDPGKKRQLPKPDRKKIKKLEQTLNTRHDQIRQAAQIGVALATEAERLAGVAREPGTSVLERVSAENETSYPTFTRYSAYEWLKVTFGIDVPEWAPPTPPVTEEKPVKAMRVDEKKNYQLIVGGLITLYLGKAGGPTYGTPNAPNARQIAKAISTALKTQRIPEDELALGTIEAKLGEVKKTWKAEQREK